MSELKTDQMNIAIRRHLRKLVLILVSIVGFQMFSAVILGIYFDDFLVVKEYLSLFSGIRLILVGTIAVLIVMMSIVSLCELWSAVNEKNYSDGDTLGKPIMAGYRKHKFKELDEKHSQR